MIYSIKIEKGQHMKIGIGNDHSALEMKAEIIEFLKEKGHEVVNYGTDRKAATIRYMERPSRARWRQARWIRES